MTIGIVLALLQTAAGAQSAPTTSHVNTETLVFSDFHDVAHEWRRRSDIGSQLIDIERIVGFETIQYSASWIAGTGKGYLGYSRSWKEFEAKLLELAPKSLRLIDFEVYDENGETHFIGVWAPGKDNFVLWSCLTWRQFVETWQQFNGVGLSLIDIESLSGTQESAYFGLFRESMTEQALGFDKDWAAIALW